MTFDDLIKHFGSQAEAARAIGIKPPSVSEWKEKGVPEPRQAQYELITGGALRADLPKSSAAGENEGRGDEKVTA